MPVSSISYQPNTAQLLAAYRPIRFKVLATATGEDPIPPFVSCDVYIEDVYYKSLIRTAPESFTVDDSVFTFDIADVLQEYMQPDIAAIDNRDVLPAPHMSAKVYCKFRASGLNVDGFTVEEPTKPIQATKFTPAVAGTGTTSNTFFAINSVLQQEDNQNLASHLNAYKQGGWDSNAYPLSHRNRYFICPGDSDHYPVIYRGDCLSADLVLNYKLKGSNVFQTATAEDYNACEPIGFSTPAVNGKEVTITLDDPVPAGHKILVRYKKQVDINAYWIEAAYTTQTIVFRIPLGVRFIFFGDYTLEVIHFCSDCNHADAVTDEFTIGNTPADREWRGVNPYCLQQTFEDPIYITLELRNQESDTTYFPNQSTPYVKNVFTTADLYAKFFSDASHLSPLDFTQADLTIYLKKHEQRIDNNSGGTYGREIENIQGFTVDADGVEVLLGQVTTRSENYQYNSYPTVASSSDGTFTFTPYPTHILTGGNTGQRGFTDLQEFNVETNGPIPGTTKPNDPEDDDYIAPAGSAQCPAGPNQTTTTYGYGLQIAKVEYGYSGQFVYPETVSNTGGGGYTYVLPLPKSTNITLAVKAKTLDAGNTSGFVKVRVTYVNSAGLSQTQVYNIPNNIETGIPGTFQNISNVNISNY